MLGEKTVNAKCDWYSKMYKNIGPILFFTSWRSVNLLILNLLLFFFVVFFFFFFFFFFFVIGLHPVCLQRLQPYLGRRTPTLVPSYWGSSGGPFRCRVSLFSYFWHSHVVHPIYVISPLSSSDAAPSHHI